MTEDEFDVYLRKNNLQLANHDSAKTISSAAASLVDFVIKERGVVRYSHKFLQAAIKNNFHNNVGQALAPLFVGLNDIDAPEVKIAGGYLTLTSGGEIKEREASQFEKIRYAFVEPVPVSSAQPKEESLQQTETSS